jgi:hypothetical protein
MPYANMKSVIMLMTLFVVTIGILKGLHMTL